MDFQVPRAPGKRGKPAQANRSKEPGATVRSRSPNLHTARRCEERAKRGAQQPKSLSKDDLAPCMRGGMNGLVSPAPRAAARRNKKAADPLPDIGNKQIADLIISPKRRPSSSGKRFFEYFMPNATFNTPEQLNLESIQPTIVEEIKPDTQHSLERKAWNLKHQDQQVFKPKIKDSLIASQEKSSEPSYSTPQTQASRPEPASESKYETMLNLLLMDARNSKILIQYVREGRDESEILRQIAEKESYLSDLRALLEKPKRKSVGGKTPNKSAAKRGGK